MDDITDVSERAERSLHKKFAREIWGNFTKAIKTYRLINEGDKIAVCISGGKDSMLMGKLFQEIQKHSDVPFGAEYIVMNPGYSPRNLDLIQHNAELLKLPVKIFDSDIFNSVVNIE